MQDKVFDAQVNKPGGTLTQQALWDWYRASGFAESDVAL